MFIYIFIFFIFVEDQQKACHCPLTSHHWTGNTERSHIFWTLVIVGAHQGFHVSDDKLCYFKKKKKSKKKGIHIFLIEFTGSSLFPLIGRLMLLTSPRHLLGEVDMWSSVNQQDVNSSG